MAVEQFHPDPGQEGSHPVAFKIRPGVEFTMSVDPATGVERGFAKDRRTGDVFHLGAEEYFICGWLNGASSFNKIQSAFAARFNTRVTKAQFQALLEELQKANLLVESMGSELAPVGESHSSTIAAVVSVSDARFIGALDPSAVVGLLHAGFGWLRGAKFLFASGLVVACFVLFNSQTELKADFDAIGFSISSIFKLLAAIVICSLIARLVQGAVSYHFGADVRSLGVSLTFGFIPQIQIDRRGLAALPKRARLWAHASPLIARLTLFIVGTTLWAVFRGNSATISETSLLIGQVGFWSFVFTAIPVLPTDGYLLFSTLIDRPDLLDRAARMAALRIQGKKLPAAMSPIERRALSVFALASLFVIAIGMAAAVIVGGAFLERRLSGTGIVILLALVGVAILWLRLSWATLQRMRGSARQPTRDGAKKIISIPVHSARGGAPTVADSYTDNFVDSRRRIVGLPGGWVVGAFLAGFVFLLALLPYDFEAGGDFIILPTMRTEVRTRIDGVIEKIHVREGDIVANGQLIADLAVWEERRDLEIARASLAKAEAELRVLEAGASEETIEASKARVYAARVRADLSTSEFRRMRPLGESGVISGKQAATYEGEYLKNKADLAAAEASLAQTEAGASQNALDAARADVAKLNAQIEYLEQQVEASNVTAPMAGRIVSSNLDLQLGSYLTVGGLLTIIEDTSVAQAQILVPQASIAEVEVGDEVQLKPVGYSGTVLTGRVVSIAPAAESTDRGQFIRVKTEIDNSLGILLPQMTGYAKIEGSRMSVLEAFTRIYVRFFQIEVWSWIP